MIGVDANLTLTFFGTSTQPSPEDTPVCIQEPSKSVPSVLTAETQALQEQDLEQVFEGGLAKDLSPGAELCQSRQAPLGHSGFLRKEERRVGEEHKENGAAWSRLPRHLFYHQPRATSVWAPG